MCTLAIKEYDAFVQITVSSSIHISNQGMDCIFELDIECYHIDSFAFESTRLILEPQHINHVHTAFWVHLHVRDFHRPLACSLAHMPMHSRRVAVVAVLGDVSCKCNTWTNRTWLIMKWWILWLVLRIHLEPFNCSVNLIATLLSHSFSFMLAINSSTRLRSQTHTHTRTNIVYHFSYTYIAFEWNSLLIFTSLTHSLSVSRSPSLALIENCYFIAEEEFPLRSWFAAIEISVAIPQPWVLHTNISSEMIKWPNFI